MAGQRDPQGPDVDFPAGSLFPDVHTRGDAGVPTMPEGPLPNEGPSDTTATPAPLSGSLATSGPDDQARGETASGLGTADVEDDRG